MARLVKKTLFVGVAYLISNWNNLARIVVLESLPARPPGVGHRLRLQYRNRRPL